MPISVLIVEDEMIIAAKISLQLSELGYEVAGIMPKGEAAIAHCLESQPDLILMDINLKGKLDGIETVREIQKKIDVPIIYLTANADEANFDRAKATRPYGFISKPFKRLDLQRAIELAIIRTLEGDGNETSNLSAIETPFILSDRIFVRYKDSMIKVILKDILYMEADRSYCRIYSRDADYLLSNSLKTLEDKLPKEHFMRVHRSFIINLLHVEKVSDAFVVIGEKAIPIARSYRAEFVKRIPFI